MPLRPRTVAATAVLILLVAAAASAIVMLGPPPVPLVAPLAEVDRVTLYQDGLVFVDLPRTFVTAGGPTALEFSLPATVVFDSVTLSGPGLAVLEMRSTLDAQPVVRPGDTVVVHVEGQSFRGTVLSSEAGRILLATPGGSTIVEMGKVAAIEVAGREAEQPGAAAAKVTAMVDAGPGPGNRTVRLAYLARGPGWTPSFRLDAGTGAFAFAATLTGLEDLHNVSLDLVAGAPNIVSVPPPAPQVPGMRAEAAAVAADAGFAPAQRLGELQRYHLERNITLLRGETVRLPVREGVLDIARHYFAADASAGFGAAGGRQEVTVLEREQVRNGFPEPLPGGIVRVYRGGTWVAEDVMPPLAVGAHANLTLARADEVEAEGVVEASVSTPDRDRVTFALTVRNLRTDPSPADVRATVTYPSFRTNLVSTEPPPAETLGSTLVWNAMVPPAGAATFRLTYETVRTP